MSVSYNLLLKPDAALARYTTSEDKRYSHLFQLVTIMGETVSGREVLISKVDTSLIACLNCVRVFYDGDAPERMSVEEILTHIGFTVQEKSEVMLS